LGDGSPVFASDPRNYKPASFGFCAQRGASQPKLGRDNTESLRRVVVDDDAGKPRAQGTVYRSHFSAKCHNLFLAGRPSARRRGAAAWALGKLLPQLEQTSELARSQLAHRVLLYALKRCERYGLGRGPGLGLEGSQDPRTLGDIAFAPSLCALRNYQGWPSPPFDPRAFAALEATFVTNAEIGRCVDQRAPNGAKEGLFPRASRN
jgi:hypothetical protein